MVVPTPPLPKRIGIWAIDGALLGLLMVAMGTVVTVIMHPGSPVAAAVESPHVRRALIGLGMGLTVIALIYSPWGGRSGALMNPATTLAFLRLGRIRTSDALGYMVAQFIGASAGVLLFGMVAGSWFTAPPVGYAPTVPGLPGWRGAWIAFAAEAVMAFGMMFMVLVISNQKAVAKWTGLVAGTLVMVYITIAAPLSGMSLNPARTVASSLPSGRYDALWVYLLAPVSGMLLATEAYGRLRAMPKVHCCKLNHATSDICIHCGCDGPIRFEHHQGTPT